MTVYRNEGRWDKSNVQFEHERIVRYSKTSRSPEMAHIDYGLGAIRTRALERIPSGVPFDLARFYERTLVLGQLAAYEVRERFYEVGSFDGIHELEERFKGEAPCNSSDSFLRK